MDNITRIGSDRLEGIFSRAGQSSRDEQALMGGTLRLHRCGVGTEGTDGIQPEPGGTGRKGAETRAASFGLRIRT